MYEFENFYMYFNFSIELAKWGKEKFIRKIIREFCFQNVKINMH